MDVHFVQWGERGAPVLLVHGSVTDGETSWTLQRPLAERYRLYVMDRRGFHPERPADGEDFEVDARDVVDVLVNGGGGGGGMHLVGHSYGAVAALLAAARRPTAVRSLTVIEPPAFGVAPADPHVAAMAAAAEEYWAGGPRDPEAFLRGFLELSGSAAKLPKPVPPPLLEAARLLMAQRSPGEARIPLDELRRAPFRTLVVSGGHSEAFERICDALADGIDAERAVIPGAGHSVQRTGAPFNELLAAFVDDAEVAATRRR